MLITPSVPFKMSHFPLVVSFKRSRFLLMKEITASLKIGVPYHFITLYTLSLISVPKKNSMML